MTNDRLRKLHSQFAAMADKNYTLFQETGIPKYKANVNRYSDIADAILIAMNNNDDHTELLNMRADLIGLACEAEAALMLDDKPELKDAALEHVIDAASVRGLFKKRWVK